MLYPRFKAETPLQFVDNIGDDEKSLNRVLKLVNKQLEGYPPGRWVKRKGRI